jgi:hypothetical protein
LSTYTEGTLVLDNDDDEDKPVKAEIGGPMNFVHMKSMSASEALAAMGAGTVLSGFNQHLLSLSRGCLWIACLL